MTYVRYEGSLLEVHLNRIVARQEKYFVELKRDDEKLACFDMKLDPYDRWTVVKPVPVWVSRLVPELIEAIQNHRKFFN